VINKTVLPNGVKVVSKKIPHVRSVSMGVWVSVGARDETSAQSGLSHFIEHMIFKGTARRSAYQIAKAFDAIGGQTNAFTSMEYTCYHARVLDAHLTTMVDILSDIFLNSQFDAQEVDRERPVILQEIGMVEDSPEEYLHLVAGRDFWGNHPLGRSILGTPDNILTFTAQSIKDFFHQFYHPERIIISVAGNVDHAAFVDQVGRPSSPSTMVKACPIVLNRSSRPAPRATTGIWSKPIFASLLRACRLPTRSDLPFPCSIPSLGAT
jgi:predicted Zn-dependent peptidase